MTDERTSARGERWGRPPGGHLRLWVHPRGAGTPRASMHRTQVSTCRGTQIEWIKLKSSGLKGIKLEGLKVEIEVALTPLLRGLAMGDPKSQYTARVKYLQHTLQLWIQR